MWILLPEFAAVSVSEHTLSPLWGLPVFLPCVEYTQDMSLVLSLLPPDDLFHENVCSIMIDINLFSRTAHIQDTKLVQTGIKSVLKQSHIIPPSSHNCQWCCWHSKGSCLLFCVGGGLIQLPIKGTLLRITEPSGADTSLQVNLSFHWVWLWLSCFTINFIPRWSPFSSWPYHRWIPEEVTVCPPEVQGCHPTICFVSFQNLIFRILFLETWK